MNEKQPRRRQLTVFALLILAAFAFRFSVARYLPDNLAEDSRVYTQMARNMLEQHVYSHATKPPFQPSIIRLPGYSIFIAAVYAVFGHTNDTAVRMIQALLDTLTCALVALIAWYWEPDDRRKRATSIAALALAAVCPFTTIYVATVLSETWASLFAVTLCLLATLALKSATFRQSLWWWTATGVVGGLSVFFRPDSGLFVAAVGMTLVVSALLRKLIASESRSWPSRVFTVIAQGALLSIAFALVLVPWTVRNWRQFHVFQPLSPAHGEMPGEFVSLGYYSWLRTWLDDRKYIDPLIWSVGESQVDIDALPANAFDSAEEKARVTALFDRYNNPPDDDPPSDVPPPATEPPPDAKPAGPAPTPSPETDNNDQSDQPDQQSTDQAPEMTRAIDAAFGQIARERIARSPLRYYLWVPLKRARTLWVGPHAEYYPFAGELFPLKDLDRKTHQQVWLPVFAVLVGLYSLLGIAGMLRLVGAGKLASRPWLMLVVLMIVLRLAFFSTMENPEPRYTVELFPFLAILGGIAIGRLVRRRPEKSEQN